MTVPRDVVDAWTWTDGWRLVRPVSVDALREMRREMRERGFRDPGTGPSVERVLFEISPDGAVMMPVYFYAAESDAVSVTLYPLRHRSANDFSGWKPSAEEEMLLLEGLGRVLQVLSSLPPSLVISDPIHDILEMFRFHVPDEVARGWYREMLEGTLENHGSPSPGGEVSLLLGDFPAEFVAPMRELLE